MSTNFTGNKKELGALIEFILDAEGLSKYEMMVEMRENGLDIDIPLPRILRKIQADLDGEAPFAKPIPREDPDDFIRANFPDAKYYM